MASSPCGNTNFDSGLEIKTRSVEQTLVPLVSQVSGGRKPAPFAFAFCMYAFEDAVPRGGGGAAAAAARRDKKPYLSLPRPGKHTANLKTAKAVKLDSEEQTSMAKLGVELRLLSSDVDGELDKWEEQEHDVVRHSQSLASMAYSMYLFTRGEGLLKTTLDLFHQAEVLSEEGIQLCSSLRNFSVQVVEEEKAAVMTEMEKLLALCQQLQTGSKTPVQGKTATFQKVDSSIQTSRAIMAIVLSLLPLCNKLNRKYKSERSSLGSPQGWRERQESSTPVREDGALNGKNSNGFGVKSLGEHMASMNLLESK
ncbi:unnamed protein product [Merluccius merluccius]